MNMLHVGNKPLTWQRAKTLLISEEGIHHDCAVKPKGGEAYLFQSRSINSKLDFGCDQCRFLLKGSGKNENLAIYKRYYQLKDHESWGRKTVSSFQHHVYSLRRRMQRPATSLFGSLFGRFFLSSGHISWKLQIKRYALFSHFERVHGGDKRWRRLYSKRNVQKIAQ